MPPYPFAAIMLMAWPIFTAIIFMRMERVNAFLWSILLGYMLLPPSIGIDLPVVPALSKYEIASLSVLLMLSLGIGKKRMDSDPMTDGERPALPGVIKILIFMYISCSAATVLTNSDPLIEGITRRPGMQLSDVATAAIVGGIELIPFLIGFRLLSTPRQTQKLHFAMMFAVLIYTIPMLMEVRLSPQLNVWIYGYFQHDFVQAIRYGGFRPLVFMTHPIWVASFLTMGFLSTLCLARSINVSPRMVLIILYLMVVLVLCKTATAILLSSLAMPLILFASPRLILTISAMVAIAVLSYPLLRLMNMIPADGIVEFVAQSQPERADSLRARFNSELILMERAMLRPAFGWGAWGRNFPIDPDTGRYSVMVDGAWVISFGTRGVLGYLAQFGLLVAPILILWRRGFALFRQFDRSDSLMIVTVALMMAVNLIELIPNATLTPLTWLLNGTVLGHASRLKYSRELRRRWRREDSETIVKPGIRPAL